MASPALSPLSAGLQQLFNDGLLPSALTTTTLNSASTTQLNDIVNTNVDSQQIGTLLGFTSNPVADTATLSSAATNALVSEFTPTYNTNATANALNNAVANALTSKIDDAVDQFVPETPAATGTQFNLLA